MISRPNGNHEFYFQIIVSFDSKHRLRGHVNMLVSIFHLLLIHSYGFARSDLKFRAAEILFESRVEHFYALFILTRSSQQIRL